MLIDTAKPQFIRAADAALYCGVSRSTLRDLRCKGDGPRYYRFERNTVYRIDDLEAWMATKLQPVGAGNDNH
jgi:hypothetical protein